MTLEKQQRSVGMLNINKNTVFHFLDAYTEVVLLISVWNNLLSMSIQSNTQYYQESCKGEKFIFHLFCFLLKLIMRALNTSFVLFLLKCCHKVCCRSEPPHSNLYHVSWLTSTAKTPQRENYSPLSLNTFFGSTSLENKGLIAKFSRISQK